MGIGGLFSRIPIAPRPGAQWFMGLGATDLSIPNRIYGCLDLPLDAMKQENQILYFL
jgi:hypothetical protein